VILTAHQPSYLPWLGYFEKISRSDVYVFLDSVQLEKNSYSYRNKIKTPNGLFWLTVPLKMKGHTSNCIKDIIIDNTQQWKKKHLKNIFYNYKKAPFFDELYPKLDVLYKENYEFFSEFAYNHLLFWMNELDIKTKIIKSSELPIKGKKSDLILDLCKHLEADKYISGFFGKDYLIEKDFIENGILIEYQDYKHPMYRQLHGDFSTHLGVVDYCMNSNKKIFK